MRYSITLQGYRNFNEPVTILIGDGNVALIGPNNIGKSNFLKFFYEFKPILGNALNLLNQTSDVSIAINDLGDQVEYLPRNGGAPFKCTLTIEEEQNKYELKSIHITSRGKENPSSFLVAGTYANGLSIESTDPIPQHVDNNHPNNEKISAAIQHIQGFKYFGASRTSTSRQGSGSHFDLIVGSQLVTKWLDWRFGTVIQSSEQANIITKQISDIFGFKNLYINVSNTHQDLFFESNGTRQTLSEMGFGLSQFFTVLVNVAIAKPTVLLIDEPESNLHASLQLKFLNALNVYCESIVFSTHSIGLARQVANRIYSFVPNHKTGNPNVREFIDPKSLPAQLGELSFSAHREIGFEYVLLVEGPTDLQVFQVILQTLGFGAKVVILNLGGSSNISANAEAQIIEIKRLINFESSSPKLAVIIDSEKDSGTTSEQRVKDFEALLINNSIPNCILKRRSIEHYFTQNHLDGAGLKQTALQHTEVVPNNWNKNSNFKAAAKMTESEILDLDFGIFLKKWII